MKKQVVNVTRKPKKVVAVRLKVKVPVGVKKKTVKTSKCK